MDHPQPQCQERLLMKVTLVVPVYSVPFRKVPLEAAREASRMSLVSLMPELHVL